MIKNKLIKEIFKIEIGLLICLFVLKLCFNIWYPIILDTPRLLWFSKLLDTNIIIRNIIYLILYVFSSYLILLILNLKKAFSLKKSLLIITCFAMVNISKYNYNNIAMIIETLLFVIFSINNFKSIKKIIYMSLVGLIIILFQLTLLFVRGVGNINDLPAMINIILQIDYYIFLITIYTGGCYMGVISVWFFGKNSVEVKANIERELSKEKLAIEYKYLMKK